MPKFIVIEGSNGSGKQTQATMLTQYFKNVGYKALMISFPNYDNEGCTPVKMYFSGAFGANAMDMDAYQSSVLFAVDRLTTLKTINLEEFDFIVFDRYTHSNLVHQANKIQDTKLINDFLKYWTDFEFNKLKLPRADMVCYLDVPFEISQELTNGRQLKFGEEKDIEEKDEDLERRVHETGLYVANKLGWKVVSCAKNGGLMTRDEIHGEVVNFVLSNLNRPERKRRKTNKNKKVKD